MQALNSVNTLGYRLMVGQRPLKPLIGVRIPVSQPSFRIRFFAKMRSYALRRDGGFREITPRVFEMEKKRAGREAGVRANLPKKISFSFEIFFGSDNYGLVTV